MRATVSSMKRCGVQLGFMPQISKMKLRRIAVPCGVWCTSGWNCTAQYFFAGFWMAATAFSLLAISSKPGGSCFGFVAVRHPDRQRAFETFEQRRVGMQQVDLGVAVLALVAGHDFAAQLVRHELQAVADAEHRQAEMQHALVGGRRIGVIDRAWASGEDDAGGIVLLNFFQRSGAGQDDGEDVLFADAARDELRVLRAEVEDDDRLGFHYLLCQRIRTV